jgi:hypothetical protein
MGQDLVTVGCVQVLVFVFQIKAGGPKSLSASVHCLGSTANRIPPI